MARQRAASPLFAVVLVLLVVGVLWLWDGRTTSPSGEDGPTDPPSASLTPASRPSSTPSAARSARVTRSAPAMGSASGTDPASGLRWVRVGQLPPEAGETLELIDHGGPYPYDRDGVVFGNFEGILPQHQRGYYHEYTVPTPGEGDRGARRIVTGGRDEFFYTGDHYASFARIDR